MPKQPLPAAIHHFAEEVLFMARTMAEADEIQWTAAPVPTPRDDTTERAKGGPANDPTLATVIDERRMKVRSAYDESHAVMEEATAKVLAARGKLRQAVDEWNGKGQGKKASV